MQFKKVCVLGLGYIGLPTASSFASHGLQVTGVDTNPAVISSLSKGGIHISEPGLADLVRVAFETGRLSLRGMPEHADAYIIAVPTPFFEHEEGTYDGESYRLADMSYVKAAAQSITPHLQKGNLVVLESTSPPRTTIDLVQPILEGSGLRGGSDFFLAYTPERVLPGQIIRELMENARVIGGIDQASAEAGRDLYAHFVTGEIILTDATTAEMVKLMENTYRDINIAIANEFSKLAVRFGIDIWEAIKIANRHPRVKILNPGPGVGGHCISVDPWFLVEAAPDLTELISAARRVNDVQPYFVVEMISEQLGEDLAGKRIAALGLAFKPDVDDLRESPAIDVARQLAELGAIVTAYEPYKRDAEIADIQAVASIEEAVRGADLLVLLVGHQDLKNLDPARLRLITPAKLAVDTVGGWDRAAWSAAGFRLVRLGVGGSQ